MMKKESLIFSSLFCLVYQHPVANVSSSLAPANQPTFATITPDLQDLEEEPSDNIHRQLLEDQDALLRVIKGYKLFEMIKKMSQKDESHFYASEICDGDMLNVDDIKPTSKISEQDITSLRNLMICKPASEIAMASKDHISRTEIAPLVSRFFSRVYNFMNLITSGCYRVFQQNYDVVEDKIFENCADPLLIKRHVMVKDRDNGVKATLKYTFSASDPNFDNSGFEAGKNYHNITDDSVNNDASELQTMGIDCLAKSNIQRFMYNILLLVKYCRNVFFLDVCDDLYGPDDHIEYLNDVGDMKSRCGIDDAEFKETMAKGGELSKKNPQSVKSDSPSYIRYRDLQTRIRAQLQKGSDERQTLEIDFPKIEAPTKTDKSIIRIT